MTSNGLVLQHIAQLFKNYLPQLEDVGKSQHLFQSLMAFAAQNDIVFVIDDFLGSTEKQYKHMFPHQPVMRDVSVITK